jgi:hypothetical protein
VAGSESRYLSLRYILINVSSVIDPKAFISSQIELYFKLSRSTNLSSWLNLEVNYYYLLSYARRILTRRLISSLVFFFGWGDRIVGNLNLD